MLILFIANLFDMPAWKVTVLLQLLSDHLLKILYSLMLLFIFVNDWFTRMILRFIITCTKG
jgi:hypothetical protein